MDDVQHIAYCENMKDYVESLLRQRYGRRAVASGLEPGLSIAEVGYRTCAGYWGLGQVLDFGGTSFQTLHKEVRQDLLMADLLLFPGQAPRHEWAQLFGYRSADALGRAFRERHGVKVADARRIGTVGAWLDMAERRPRTSSGLDRIDEARRRIEAFRRVVRNVGVEGRVALDALGRKPRTPTPGARRPRYPAVGIVEAARLEALGA